MLGADDHVLPEGSLASLADQELCVVLALTPCSSHGSLSITCSRFHHILHSDSFTAVRRTMNCIEECIVIVGGLDRNNLRPLSDCWILSKDLEWHHLLSLPIPQAQGCLSVLSRSKLILSGGLYARAINQVLGQYSNMTGIVAGLGDEEEVRDTVLGYDLYTGIWEALPVLQCPRRNAACGVVGGKAIVAGGQRDGILGSVEVFSKTQGWSALAPMPDPVFGAACAVLEGKLLVAGGFSTSVSDQLRIFDVDSDVWTMGQPLPSPRDSAAGVAYGGLFYVIGGCDADGDPADTVFAYNLKEDCWNVLDHLHLPYSLSPCRAVVYEGNIVILGGGYPPLMLHSQRAEWLELNTRNGPAWHKLTEPCVAAFTLG